MIIDKDMTEWKLTVGPTTYYYACKEHLVKALTEVGGWSMIKMAAYIVENGQFTKSRSFDVDLANVILKIGRKEINNLFDFMEKN